MNPKEILDRLVKCYRTYLDGDMKSVECYDDKFYDGVLWAFARLTEIQSSDDTFEEKPQGEWIVTAEDNEGIHRIQCPFCRYEKGSDFIDYITVTFEKLPPFCENCGAKMQKGGAEE